MSFIDARELPENSTLTATVVIVGTGPAGATIARELAPTGVDILLVEGGSLSRSPEHDDTLKADQRSQGVEPMEKARTKRLGGASTQWGGRTYPFDALDFEDRVEGGLNFKGWPISREDLNPFYVRATQAAGVKNMQYTAAEAIKGAPQHLMGESDIVNTQGIWRWGPPVNFGKVVTDEISKFGNVRVLHNANVTHVIQDPETGRVTELKAQSKPGRHLSISGTEIVLAMGGLETARVLLNSNVGNENDQVGRNYTIHPIGEVGKLTLTNPESEGNAVTYTKSHDGVWVRRNLQIHEDVRRREGLLNMGFAIWYDEPRSPEHGDPLLSSFALVRKMLTMTGGFKGTGMHRRYAELQDPKAHVLNVVKGLPSVGAFGVHWLRDRILDPRTLPSFTRYSKRGVYRIRFDAEQAPRPEQRVLLSTEEKDAYGVPRLDVQHFIPEEDRRNYHRSLELLAEGINATGFATYVPPTLDEMLTRQMVDATHQMGLVRMGANPAESVVDKDLKVWSSPNLYLSTTGAFTTGGMAGPTLTVIAISIRLADHLAKKLGL